MIEKAVTFECMDEQLVGILSDPGGDCKVGVIVVVGGPQYRIGSHRQFLSLARQLGQAGFPVLRFDYRGMGDSSGASRSFEHIEPDIKAAIGAITAACPKINKVVLWGICDAASANLLYWQATADSRVAGMVLLNPWVMSEVTYAQHKIKGYYLRRLITGDFWLRLARGSVDLPGALRSIAGYIKRASGLRKPGESQPHIDYRDRMRMALARFTGPVLVVLSGADLTGKAFLEYVQSQPAWHGLIERPNVERHELELADHTFSTAAWRGEVEALTLHWLRRSFSAARGVPQSSLSKDH